MRHLATVLVLEEDPTLRHSLALILQQAGYEPTAAASHQETLGYLEKQCYELLLLDIGNFEADGPALLLKIRLLCPQTPILILTADIPFETTTGLGFQDNIGFLLKPINPKCLLAEIHSRLNRKHVSGSQPNQPAATAAKAHSQKARQK